jgi:hypothetical protein
MSKAFLKLIATTQTYNDLYLASQIVFCISKSVSIVDLFLLNPSKFLDKSELKSFHYLSHYLFQPKFGLKFFEFRKNPEIRFLSETIIKFFA